LGGVALASSDRNLASLGQLNADIAQGPNLINRAMSAFGTKRTCHRCPRISVINPLLSISASLFIVTSPLLVPSLVRETKFKVWVNSINQSVEVFTSNPSWTPLVIKVFLRRVLVNPPCRLYPPNADVTG
jgi:hypothetical protein